jgi:hypothetical protein
MKASGKPSIYLVMLQQKNVMLQLRVHKFQAGCTNGQYLLEGVLFTEDAEANFIGLGILEGRQKLSPT